jgi:hypothetical protein
LCVFPIFSDYNNITFGIAHINDMKR